MTFKNFKEEYLLNRVKLEMNRVNAELYYIKY